MHSINRLNFKVGTFLLFLTLGLYSVHALLAYNNLLETKYFIEYKGTIINRWVESENGRINKHYIKLSPKDKTLSEYTTSVDHNTYENYKVGSKVKLVDEIWKKDCIKGYKVTEEETKLRNCCGDYLLLSIFSFICCIIALSFTILND